MPTYTEGQIGRVTSTNDYTKYGRIEVILIDYGQPFPVWVSGDVDREPVSGDLVLLGYLQGRPDAPYMLGFVRNESYTANFVLVTKDKITIQFPTDPVDVEEHLLDDAKKVSRMTIEVTASGVVINGGTSGVARVGDAVQVMVPDHGLCSGTITSGSDITKA